jgi:hypothetical protein
MPLSNPITESQIPLIFLTELEGDARYRRSTVKEIILSGALKSTAGDTLVPYQIPTNSIVVGIQCAVRTVQNWRIPPGFVNTTYDYFAYVTPTDFVIYVPGSGANSGGVMGRPFHALISYIS